MKQSTEREAMRLALQEAHAADRPGFDPSRLAGLDEMDEDAAVAVIDSVFGELFD